MTRKVMISAHRTRN